MTLKLTPPPIDPSPSPETQQLTAKAAEELEGREHQQILDHRERFAEISYGIMQAWVGFLIVLTTGQFSLKPLHMGLERSEWRCYTSQTRLQMWC